MKKLDKSQIGKANEPLPTHKEIVAKITEENRAYFDKKDAGAGAKTEKKKYPASQSNVSRPTTVASRVMCKSWERVLGPMLVHTIKDAE